MAKVTYVPHKGDPAEVEWNKFHFRANEPVDVSDHVMIDDVKMLDKVKGNPHFKVEDEKKPAIESHHPIPRR